MGIKLAIRENGLSDEYILFAQQIGVDGLDIHNCYNIPGVKERGYPDIEGLLKLKKKLKRHDLEIYRVSAPSIRRYLLGESGGEKELENLLRTVKCMGEASIPVLVVTLAITKFWKLGEVPKKHKGGYSMYAFDMRQMEEKLADNPQLIVDHEIFWDKCIKLFEKIAPVAEDSNVKIAIHPQDPPIPESKYRWTVGFLGWNRIFEAVPSRNIGVLYCCGTRREAGANIYEEIRYLGGRGKIFHVHLRNVRGSLPRTGSYEEVAVDDGEMNLYEILKTLKEVGYEGAVNPDHIPRYIGDSPTNNVAWAYAAGYVKGLLAALNNT